MFSTQGYSFDLLLPGGTLVQQLLKRGSRLDQLNNSGETPLSIAVEVGATEAVQALLCSGPYLDPNTALRRSPCQTPLQRSLYRGNFHLARTLLVAGYRGHSQLQNYIYGNLENTPTELPTVTSTLSTSESVHRNYIIDHGLNPLTLQDLCRNKIRCYLGHNIEDVDHLGLPSKLTEFLQFQDFYSLPESSTMHGASSLGVNWSDVTWTLVQRDLCVCILCHLPLFRDDCNFAAKKHTDIRYLDWFMLTIGQHDMALLDIKRNFFQFRGWPDNDNLRDLCIYFLLCECSTWKSYWPESTETSTSHCANLFSLRSSCGLFFYSIIFAVSYTVYLLLIT